jgi:hypothetical protein
MDSPQTRLERALQGPTPGRAALDLARALRDEGMSQLELHRLFDEFRALHESDANEVRYDAILDAMDCISGWCGSCSRLYDTELPHNFAGFLEKQQDD